MQQALPKNTPTLPALATKNWTCPDNVFCSKNTCKSFIHCYTEPCFHNYTDHVPIISILELETPKLTIVPKHNLRETDWTRFNAYVKKSTEWQEASVSNDLLVDKGPGKKQGNIETLTFEEQT
jgi:hypothetical protein